MSRKRKPASRRPSSIGTTGRVTPPNFVLPLPPRLAGQTGELFAVVFTDCPGCELCEALTGTGGSFTTIHRIGAGPGQSVPTKAESPRRHGPGLSFDPTPVSPGADLRWTS